MRKVYTSVDLGSSTIKIMVGEIFNKKLNVLGTAKVESRGIKKGVIVDANEIISSLREAISNIESMLNITIDNLISLRIVRRFHANNLPDFIRSHYLVSCKLISNFCNIVNRNKLERISE